MSEAGRVLATTELLEAILLDLPQRDVLLLTRTCRAWKEIVKGSVKLQRYLFFLAAGDVTLEPSKGWWKVHREYRKALKEAKQVSYTSILCLAL